MQSTPEKTSARMARQRVRDTAPELALRRELHSRGLRFFVNRRVLTAVRREADVVFPRARVVVLLDGCFWHGCPEHGTSPQRNAEFWRTKIEKNQTRDADTTARLTADGWFVLRFWEHADVREAADAIERAVSLRRSPDGGTGA